MKVLFLPENKQIVVEQGTTLLSAMKKAGLYMDAPCGGYGNCGKCKVLVTKGNHHEYTPEEIKTLSNEERSKGLRLACRMPIVEDTCVILPDSRANISQSSRNKATSIKGNRDKLLGLAVDVGTTTIEYAIVDMKDGSIVIKNRFYNPQRKYGADVMARITACMQDENKVKELQKDLIEELNDRLNVSLNSLGVSLNDIKKAVLVANTTMCHIVTGHNPYKLACAPFQPDYKGGDIQPANKLGLSFAEDSTVEVLPIIGGHVGADTVGCLTFLELDKMEEYHLLVDIGTNGEMVLKGKDRIVACSTAAGPAFEGSSMAYGMCAGPGAIHKVTYENNEIRLLVEGNVRPVGISGTGIIDAVATLLRAGIMDHSGYLKEEYCVIDPVSGQAGYCLFQDDESGVYITRQDIRQLQLAKAAIAAGIKILLEVAGLTLQQLSGIWIAGAFGTNLNLDNAMLLGLLPTITKTRYHQVGNAALSGAIKRLNNQVKIEELRDLTNSIIHVDLAVEKEFKEYFLREINF